MKNGQPTANNHKRKSLEGVYEFKKQPTTKNHQPRTINEQRTTINEFVVRPNNSILIKIHTIY